jgi:single-strand DNA-binding protein
MNTNKVTLIGYVGKHLLSSTKQDGTIRVSLRVATNGYRITRSGEKLVYTHWHDVVAWNKTAEYAARNFVKGSKIMVEGSISYQTYPDHTGHIRYITIITAKSLMNLDR